MFSFGRLFRRSVASEWSEHRAIWEGFVGEATRSEARGVRLLQEWLSPKQLEQFNAAGYFDVVGCDTGHQYRIYYGTSSNVCELGEAEHIKMGWCFVPNDSLVAGDVMLAQKIALETNERSVLGLANRFVPNERSLRTNRRPF